ncbi:hypothetical protein M5689_023794 [Euphorbia peplus]|nr:hypothetical protein M5689_023794 [Euphorbia peplus]
MLAGRMRNLNLAWKIRLIGMLFYVARVLSELDQTALLCISECTTCPVICSPPPPPPSPSSHHSPRPPSPPPPQSVPASSPPPPPKSAFPPLQSASSAAPPPPTPPLHPPPPKPGVNVQTPKIQGQSPFPYYYFYTSKANSSLYSSLFNFVFIFLLSSCFARV